MSAGLIKHLRKKTDEDSNTRILMSQWEFDEKLVGKSLENVGSYYPHFSSHNESHSQQILVNIERLLGNNIEKLTATDTWLILEAAYWHDIGMLFNADEVQKVFEENDFKEYVESLANDNTQDLHEFAKVWHEDGWNKALVNHSDPHTGVEKYRQMIAEWYRRGHAKNSNSVVLEPFEKLGISSPRTELLPKRIYRYLGQICWAHGLGFDDYVMKTLPFRQTGMGTENCHPRFVACLLRLGDLFDIDDNRFCPVMARQVGNMPYFSETHKHKHQAIREFQLDNETVSITAICSTEMAYIECRNWFDWIKEEIQNQMSQWKNIVPSRDFGLLPTINKLDVEMTDKKILLNDKPMRFSLDERSAIELLQGNNLYEDDMSIYRELIQNAIDATMIRVWLEHNHDHAVEPLPKNTNPYDSETRELFKKYPITLDCKKISEDEESTLWEFSIEDNGVGISKKDLEYMQKIAGSKNNKEKKKIIAQMPEWMRPSGEFGIGLHSAFLLMQDLPTDQQKIIIYTKSRLTHESLKVELNSPLSGRAGYCFIEVIDDLGKYGTKIIVLEKFSITDNRDYIDEYYVDDYPKLIDLILGVKSLGVNRALRRIIDITDIVTNPTLNFKVSPNIEILVTKYSSLFNNSLQDQNFYWDKNLGVALKLIYEDEDETTNNYYFNEYMEPENIAIMYRGQLVHSSDINFELGVLENLEMRILIDIYSSHSSNILSLSREEINNTDYINQLLEEFFESLVEKIATNNEIVLRLLNNDINKTSLFLMLTGLQESLDNNWKNYPLNEHYKFSDVIDSIGFTTGNSIKNESIANLLQENSITYINSDLLRLTLGNEYFDRVLLDNGFRKYNIMKDGLSISSQYNSISIIYYKGSLESEYLIEEPIINIDSTVSSSRFMSDNYLLGINYLLDSPNFSIKDYMNSDLYPLEFIHKFSMVNLSFLNKETFLSLEDLNSNSKLEKLFIFPFIYFENGVIEIPNDTICNIYESGDVSTNQKIAHIYNAIKKEIINIAKNKYPLWYEEYQRGLSVTPINLGNLDQLHEPAG